MRAMILRFRYSSISAWLRAFSGVAVDLLLMRASARVPGDTTVRRWVRSSRTSDISPGASRWPRGSASSCLHSTRRRWRRARSRATAASRCGSRASSASTTSRRASTSSPSRTRCSSSCPCSRGSRRRRGRCAWAPGSSCSRCSIRSRSPRTRPRSTPSPTAASCSASGSATGRRRTTRSGCREKRLAVFEQKLDVVRRLLEGEAVTAEGHGFRLRDQQLALRPTQTPRPPIWLAANNDNAVLRAARLADAWLLNPHTKLDELERQLVLYHAERERCGLPPATRDPDHQGAPRRQRRRVRDARGAAVPRGQVQGLRAVGPERGAAGGRHPPAGLRAARGGRPLHRRRPRELCPPGARARRAARRDELPVPLPVAGHAAGAGARPRCGAPPRRSSRSACRACR